MKFRTKALLVSLCAVLLMAASVLGTMAYLTDSDAVTNTFTVGQVGLSLDEAPVDANGKKTTDDRVTENTYKLIPGQIYDKDPTVHVDADSEDSWIFVKVVNGIADIEADTNTIAAQMAANGWTLVADTTDIYAYKTVVSAGNTIVVFENFTISDEVDNDNLASYAGKTIVVTAYAIQADGFDTAADAWAAADFS